MLWLFWLTSVVHRRTVYLEILQSSKALVPGSEKSMKSSWTPKKNVPCPYFEQQPFGSGIGKNLRREPCECWLMLLSRGYLRQKLAIAWYSRYPLLELASSELPLLDDLTNHDTRWVPAHSASFSNKMDFDRFWRFFGDANWKALIGLHGGPWLRSVWTQPPGYHPSQGRCHIFSVQRESTEWQEW